MSRPSLFALVSLVVLGACAPEPSKDAPPPEPAPASVPEPEPEPEAEPEPVSEPEPEPEPEVARLPDGTEILPCEEPPPGMACVPGGKFTMGRDEGGEPNEHPAVEVWLQTFYMDLYEVRNFEWKACKKLKACRRGGPLYNDFGRDDQPVTGPNWYAANEFCGWMGKHLPTEAQWEAAARGPEGELTPFGNEPVTCTNAVIEDERGRSCGVLKKKEHPKKGRVYIVGSRPPGRYGIYDMAGNAWEWVADWAAKDFAACGDECTGQEPLGICGGKETCRKADQKVVKGGSWYWTTEYAFSTHRRTHYPINEHSNFHHFGWRCAASYEEARKLRDEGPGPERPAFREPAGRETELGLPD